MDMRIPTLRIQTAGVKPSEIQSLSTEIGRTASGSSASGAQTWKRRAGFARRARLGCGVVRMFVVVRPISVLSFWISEGVKHNINSRGGILMSIGDFPESLS